MKITFLRLLALSFLEATALLVAVVALLIVIRAAVVLLEVPGLAALGILGLQATWLPYVVIPVVLLFLATALFLILKIIEHNVEDEDKEG